MSHFRVGGRVSTHAERCADCGRTMVSRRRYLQLAGQPSADRARNEHGDFVREPGRFLVRHGARGYCTTCIKKVYAAEKPSRAEVVLEEWHFLRDGGVSIEEAARRLGVTVRTICDYERRSAA